MGAGVGNGGIHPIAGVPRENQAGAGRYRYRGLRRRIDNGPKVGTGSGAHGTMFIPTDYKGTLMNFRVELAKNRLNLHWLNYIVFLQKSLIYIDFERGSGKQTFYYDIPRN